jgi:predicted O-methyltransferase YrrM
MISAFKKILFACRFLCYRFVARNEYSLHSPFVYNLYSSILKDKTPYYGFDSIESIRAKMLLSEETLEVTDFGTGGIHARLKKLSLKYIAKHFVKSRKYGQLLFRLVNTFRSENILELGTSLGISTMYLALPKSKSRVFTIEGCANTAGIARKNFNQLHAQNIEQVVGEFSDVLPEVLKKMQSLDFVYFDGNHCKEATLSYFEQCLTRHTEDSVFVFDDIHWSGDMQEAWKVIQQNEKVTLTIDVFFMGIVFFRNELHKQHFTLQF